MDQVYCNQNMDKDSWNHNKMNSFLESTYGSSFLESKYGPSFLECKDGLDFLSLPPFFRHSTSSVEMKKKKKYLEEEEKEEDMSKNVLPRVEKIHVNCLRQRGTYFQEDDFSILL